MTLAPASSPRPPVASFAPPRRRWVGRGLLAAVGLGWAFLTAPLYGRELMKTLREADQLYRTGHLDAARRRADDAHRLFPDHLEPILLGMQIDRAAGRMTEAYLRLRQAAAINPRHPIVIEYQRLFRLYQQRFGPLPVDPGPRPGPDLSRTAQSFKKGWFGPSFLAASQRKTTTALADGVRPETAGAPPGALPEAVAVIAHTALHEQRFLKAYLYFSQLHREFPHQTNYLLGKAEAALGLGRHQEARNLLNRLWSHTSAVYQAGDAAKVAALKRKLGLPE